MADLLHTAQALAVVLLCALACAAAFGRHVALLEYLRRAVAISARALVAAVTLGRVRVASETRRRVNRTRRRVRARSAERHAPADAPQPGERARSGWTGPLRADRAGANEVGASAPRPAIAAPPQAGDDAPPQLPPMIGPPAS